jgi:type IV secretory pathway VirB10-like protein
MENNQLVKVIDESGVEKQTAVILQESFMPFFQKANEWSEKAKTLIVTDVSQTREMAMARQARLALREIRIEADKVRKTLKEDSLRYGRAVQGVYNVIEYLIKPTEEYLEQQEKFVELQEAKRKAELKAVREMELQPLIEFVPYGINLSDMAEPDYQKLLNGAKLQMQQKIEEEAREKAAEEARIKAEKEEQERIRQENERLKKEAEEKEKDEQKKRELAEKKAKAAPDKQKLMDFADMLNEQLVWPEVKTAEAKEIIANTKTLIGETAAYILQNANKL